MAAGTFDAHAIKQRATHEELTASLEAKLKGAGMQFNKVDGKPFRAVLQKSGDYAAGGVAAAGQGKATRSQ